MWLKVCVLLCYAQHSAANGGESVFDLLDTNQDGSINENEAKDFITTNFNSDFQTEQEVAAAAELLLGNLDVHDGRHTSVTEAELEEHTHNLFKDFTMYDWVKYGLGLPALAATFRDKVKREDFPLLVTEDGILTEDLGIRSLLERQRVKRAVQKLLLGIGAVPGPPQELGCDFNAADSTSTLQWNPPAVTGTPKLHSYAIQLLSASPPHTPLDSWTIPEEATVFQHNNRSEPGFYRMAAWNSYGRSVYVTVHCRTVAVPPTSWAMQVLLWLLVAAVTLLVIFRKTIFLKLFKYSLASQVLDHTTGNPVVVRHFKLFKYPTALVCTMSERKVVWMHVRAIFSSRPLPFRLYWYELASGNGGDLPLREPNRNVVLMHADELYMWLATKGGYLTVWRLEDKVPLCEPLRCFLSDISSISSDSTGSAWVGSSKGSLRVVKLKRDAYESQYPFILDYLDNREFCNDASEAVFDYDAYADATTSEHKYSDMPDGRVVGTYMYNNGRAHTGPVMCLCNWTSRLWSAGLTNLGQGYTLREWRKSGQLRCNQRISKFDVGPVVTMEVFAVGMPAGLESMTSHRSLSRGGAERSPNLTSANNSFGRDRQESCIGSISSSMSWQLLTGHRDGSVVMWDIGADGVTPMVTLAALKSRLCSMALMPSLHAVCCGLANGKLVLCQLPSISDLTSFRLAPRLSMYLGRVHNTATAYFWGHFGPVTTLTGDEDLLSMDAFGVVKLWRSDDLAARAAQHGFVNLETDESPSSSSSMGEFGRRITISNTNIINKEDLTLMQRLREGSFGVVYKGMWCGTLVAVKKLRTDLLKFSDHTKKPSSDFELQVDAAAELSFDSQASIDSLQQEVTILSSLRHENVVLFLGVCLNPLCIVTSYYSMNSLYDLISRVRKDPSRNRLNIMSWKRRINMALDAAKGMYYLHNRYPAVLHCDLKSPNLLVDKDLNVKVGDFGLSRLVSQDANTSIRAFNPRWLPPEALDGTAEMSKGTDVYSFGIILWELMTLQEPYPDMQLDQVFVAVTVRHERPKIPPLDQLLGGGFSGLNDFVALMKACWAEDPNKRPDFGAIMTELQQMASQIKAQLVRSRSNAQATAANSMVPQIATATSGGVMPMVTLAPSPFAKMEKLGSEGVDLRAGPADQSPTQQDSLEAEVAAEIVREIGLLPNRRRDLDSGSSGVSLDSAPAHQAWVQRTSSS